MISPEQIRQKAERLFTKAVTAYLQGDCDFFPYRMPADLSLPDTQSELIRQVELLREQAKETRGFGYSILWEEKQKRLYGRNSFPVGIVLETMEDLVKLTRHTQEFRNVTQAVERICQQHPALRKWTEKHWRQLLPLVPVLDQLLLVTAYMEAHPRPNCYLRELPLAISTKLVEEHRGLLREWFDLLLPATAIDSGCDPRNFEQRYGFRAPQPHFLVRFLDADLAEELGCPYAELSLPLESLCGLSPQQAVVFIVENRVNLLTLPPRPRAVAMGGLGRAVTQLASIPWLRQSEVHYWGDLDVDGFEILSSLRNQLPNLRSVMMDIHTLNRYAAYQIAGNGRSGMALENLTDAERQAYEVCQQANLRLEQERIPQDFVNQMVSTPRRL